MKFLFIYPDINEVDAGFVDNKGCYYYGIAQLSSVLKEVGVQTGLLHFTSRPSKESLLRDVVEFAPDIIGFSSTTLMIEDVFQWARWLREAGILTPLVLGGSHATLDFKEVAERDLFNVIFVGESEESLLEYCRRFCDQPTDILGTVVRKMDGGYIFNAARPLEQSLDNYPFPDWNLFDYENLYDMKPHKRGILMASRGCPFRCSFCSNDRYVELYRGKGKFVRLNSVDYIVAEAKEMKKEYPSINYFQFVDDVLGADPTWLKEFSEKWPREVNMDFYGNINVNVCNQDTIRLLAQSGCRRLQIGVETGNELRRKEILRKFVFNKTYEKVIGECHKYGIIVNNLNMIGLPFETEENILETIHFNAKLRPKLLQCTIFYPFPHTYLYDFCLENGLISGNSIKSDYFRDSVLSNSSISKEVLYFYRDNFKTLVKIYEYINIDWLIKFLGHKRSAKIINLFRTRKELKKWLYQPRKN
ncbi:MAG: B12-binding domain-containing radical SAM protein [Candidatus Staskawiczbacteria bacterium]|nr:B12-binding domain-containing radical SAM protein [Candidatus Staskawiczbacteria bacterium]